MASHVCAQRVATCVSLALSTAIGPFAGVLLLSAPDMFFMYVLHEAVHIAEITGVASIPATDGNLVVALAAVVIILAAADESEGVGRVGNVAGGIGRDGGGGRRRREVILESSRNGSIAIPRGNASATTL